MSPVCQLCFGFIFVLIVLIVEDIIIADGCKKAGIHQFLRFMDWIGKLLDRTNPIPKDIQIER